MNSWIQKLGPGLMLAAAAVGVSHLVHATRAGADYGLSFIWLIILISILKYPVFRFAADYAGASGNSLVDAYSKLGKAALVWLFLALLVDMFIATSAVALVTSGLFISIFDLSLSGPHAAIILCLVTVAILLQGQYSRSENLIKVMVLIFTLFAVLATLIAIPQLGSNDRDLFASIHLDRSTASFAIAVAGWMPLPVSGAIFLSIWAREKRKMSNLSGEQARTEAQSDFNFSWILTVVLAICFAILGAAILFQTDRAIPAGAGQFATQLLSIFTSAIGEWAYVLIAVAAIAVMWSGVFALMDAVPRINSGLLSVLLNRPGDGVAPYRLFLAIQLAGIALILLFFMNNFGSFINFAASLGFLSAPAIAYYNFKAVHLDEVTQYYQVSKKLVIWHWISMAFLVIFAVGFLVNRFI